MVATLLLQAALFLQMAFLLQAALPRAQEPKESYSDRVAAFYSRDRGVGRKRNAQPDLPRFRTDSRDCYEHGGGHGVGRSQNVRTQRPQFPLVAPGVPRQD